MGNDKQTNLPPTREASTPTAEGLIKGETEKALGRRTLLTGGTAAIAFALLAPRGAKAHLYEETMQMLPALLPVGVLRELANLDNTELQTLVADGKAKLAILMTRDELKAIANLSDGDIDSLAAQKRLQNMASVRFDDLKQLAALDEKQLDALVAEGQIRAADPTTCGDYNL